VFIFDTHFWTVLGLVIGGFAVIAALAGAALGGPWHFAHRHFAHHFAHLFPHHGAHRRPLHP
jgi:hypothetical protein